MINKLEVFLNSYDKSFLATGIEISPYKLPLKSGVMVCDDDLFEGLFGVFSDSLPDGWGRLLIDRYFLKQQISYKDITPLDRLAYIGEFGIGALSYRPIVNNNINTIDDIDLDKLSNDSSKILSQNCNSNIEDFLVLGGSSSGARPKAMIQIDNTTI